MKREKIQISLEQYYQISSFLQNKGISQQDIDEIIDGEFENYNNVNDLESSFGGFRKYDAILEKLSDGYMMHELDEQGIKKAQIREFEKMLEEKNLTADQAKAIYQYSVGSNMILGVKRGTSVDAIQEQIMSDLEESLQGRGVQQEDIEQIKKFVKSVDYQSTTLHENYDITNQYMQQRDLPTNSYACVRSAIQSMDRCSHIDKTIEQLEDGIGNTKLPKSMKLYRAVKSEYLEKELKDGETIESLVGKKISNKGQTSTSPLYDSSFASLDKYDTVFEIYAPQGTRGSYIAELSAYDSAEQEVLLNPNDLYIIGVQTDVVDKNGKTKNILQALCLSKDLECYKDIAQSQISSKDENSENGINIQKGKEESMAKNLPTTQSGFSKFFNKIRVRFIKRKLEDNVQIEEKNKDIPMKLEHRENNNRKLWDLTPEKRIKIQQSQVEIGRKHKEMQETSNTDLEQIKDD